MINIAICENERSEISYLSTLVHKWAMINNICFHLSDYISAESFLFSYEDEPVDILLLDIQMGGMDGISLAKEIRKTSKKIQIIFVTGYMEYISAGYDVEALHFLIKPVNEEKLYTVLNRAIEKLERKERSLFISYAGENIQISLHEIRYLEVCKNYVTIYTNDVRLRVKPAMTYTVKKSLGKIEQELDDDFFRIGRSFIVNLRYVRKTTTSKVFLSDDTVLPLSRGLYTQLNRAIIERL